MTPEQYMRGQDAQHEPSDADFLENCGLDAYGHLSFTIGNEDWIACLDAVLSPEMERIAYHIVVDCDSGGFTDIVESGVVRIDDAEAIAKLKRMPSWYADFCLENYPAQVPEDDEAYAGPIEWKETDKAWSAHLDALIRQAEEAK